MNKGSGALLLLAAVMVGSCGKKGPPLPPLVRVAVAPLEFTAERRAAIVDLQFIIPATNTDGTRPANIERVDVYAFTGPATLTDDQVVKLGTRVASIPVKSPRDPNAVAQPDEPDADLDPLEGSGLDQGARARVREDLSALAPASTMSSNGSLRYYVGVAVSRRGRRGVLSPRVAVPLRPPPRAPAKPEIAYDESSVTLTWMPVPAADSDQATASTMAYHVYGIASVPSAGRDRETRLTRAPVPGRRFVDPRVEWGVTQCYAIGSVETRDGLSEESEAGSSTCVTPVDTFPPAAPVGLIPVGSDGTVSLTWDPNTEKDLRGYLILRGGVPGDVLTRLTPAPIQETTFMDSVQPGARYYYAVQAVDNAGNVSAASTRVDATAR